MIHRFVKGRIAKLILKGGFQFALFAICLEVFEHTILPAIMIQMDLPKLCWIGMTPLDELVIYPIVIRFFFRKGD